MTKKTAHPSSYHRTATITETQPDFLCQKLTRSALYSKRAVVSTNKLRASTMNVILWSLRNSGIALPNSINLLSSEFFSLSWKYKVFQKLLTYLRPEHRSRLLKSTATEATWRNDRCLSRVALCATNFVRTCFVNICCSCGTLRKMPWSKEDSSFAEEKITQRT